MGPLVWPELVELELTPQNPPNISIWIHSNMAFVCFLFMKELEEAAEQASLEEQKRLQTQMQLQDRFRQELEREKNVSAIHLTIWFSCNVFTC